MLFCEITMYYVYSTANESLLAFKFIYICLNVD
uniref:Uncharacterized protein n=1 Tax=Anguilla anguilla TaxID=7936 RepID=A0A0E9XV28_ANGAN